MWRRSRLISCLVASIGSMGATAHAAPAASRGAVGADSGISLSRAIEREARRLALDGTELPSQVGKPVQPQTRSHLAKCNSRKKGALIGMAVGAVAGGVLGMYVVNGASGVLGTAAGGPKVITYFTMAGGGAGALMGLLYCS